MRPAATKNNNKSQSQTSASKQHSSVFDFDQLSRLFDLMNKKGVGELEIETMEARVHVRTGATSMMTAVERPSAATAAPHPHVHALQAESQKAANEALAPNVKQIVSPLVGTYYKSPSPDAQSYVKIGQAIKPGDTLCIVEAMKLMNEIESEMSGKVVKIFKENGQPVEYGEPLFLIET